jgi:AcrR family transcriptional regulator
VTALPALPELPELPALRPTLGEAASTAVAQERRKRTRMTGPQRKEQLLDVGRALFAERGYDATAIEEVALRAGVSKPVVYAHFGGKEGLYAAVVDRETEQLLDMITAALSAGNQRELLEQAARAFLEYVEQFADGFRILARGSGVGSSAGTLTTLLDDLAARVAELLAHRFRVRGYDARLAPLYAQMLVGMVAFTGQWWLDVGHPPREDIVEHVVNLAWNGLSRLELQPTPASRHDTESPIADVSISR